MSDAVERISSDDVSRMPTTSHVACAGGFVYTTGLLGTIGRTLELAEGGVGEQTKQALRHMESVLRLAGSSLDDLVQVNVYLTNIDDFIAMDHAYGELVHTAPARTTIYCSQLPLGAAVEIDATAYVGAGGVSAAAQG